MTTLGDIIGIARRAAPAYEAWLRAADPALAQEVASTARRWDTTPSGLTRIAIANFSRYATEEDWAALARIVRDEPDAGTACLGALLTWQFAALEGRSPPNPSEEEAMP